MVVVFSGTVFKTSITSYRVASAQAEIMQKFRAITDVLDNDFRGLRKDGYIMIYLTFYNGVRSDRICFISTGDFQSWYNPNVRSNIARIYIGHDGTSIAAYPTNPNRWRLAHDVNLMTFNMKGEDYNDVNFAWCQVHPTEIIAEVNAMMYPNPPAINIAADSNTIRRLLCENVGQFKIELAYGTTDASGAIIWFSTIGGGVPFAPVIRWPASIWPKALKFIFTIYDSRGVFKDGQTFTHIVYIGD
jgi:hypothetical protein